MSRLSFWVRINIIKIIDYPPVQKYALHGAKYWHFCDWCWVNIVEHSQITQNEYVYAWIFYAPFHLCFNGFLNSLALSPSPTLPPALAYFFIFILIHDACDNFIERIIEYIYISYFWEFHIYIDKCKLCVYNTIVSLTDYKGRYLRILSHICWSVHSYISYSIPTYRCYIRICICIILFVILWCSRRFTVQRTLLSSCNGSVSIVLTRFPFFLGWVWPLLVRFLYHFLVIDAKIKLVIGIFFSLVFIRWFFHSFVHSLVCSYVLLPFGKMWHCWKSTLWFHAEQ